MTPFLRWFCGGCQLTCNVVDVGERHTTFSGAPSGTARSIPVERICIGTHKVRVLIASTEELYSVDIRW
jgi:hypothetical protein